MEYSRFVDLANKYDYFLFDCDGVLWLGNQSIEGSFDALRMLDQLGKTKILLTNASARSREEVLTKVNEIHGYNNITKHHIYTTGYITALYIIHNVLKSNQDKVLLIGESGFKNELTLAGI